MTYFMFTYYLKIHYFIAWPLKIHYLTARLLSSHKKKGDETHYKMHHHESFLQESHSAMTGKNDK